MKTTQELYLQEPTKYANMNYFEALKEKVIDARKAMTHYRNIGRVRLNKPDYEDWVRKYENSEEAKKWNQRLIEEIEISTIKD